jgi:hypothetical protein
MAAHFGNGYVIDNETNKIVEEFWCWILLLPSLFMKK